MRSLTLHLPDALAERAERYAAARGTTLDALVRSRLESMTDDPANAKLALEAFSLGRISRAEAIRELGLRDYASLLVALGDSNLSFPKGDVREIETEAESFERLWRSL